MKNVIIKQWVVYIVFLGIGITIGDWIEYGFFELDKSISIIDALTLFVTVGLTWYIARILDKQSKNEQLEYDLFIKQLNDIEELLKDIDDLIRKEASYKEVNLKIHCVGLAKSILFDLYKGKTTVKSYEDSFKEEQKKLKDLLTNTPIDQNDKSKISIKNGKVKYTEERQKEIITEIYSFRTLLFRIRLSMMQD